VSSIVDNLVAKQSTNEAVELWKEDSWLPSKMTQTAVNHLYKVMLEVTQVTDRDLIRAFVLQLTLDGAIDATNCNEAFVKLVNSNDSVVGNTKMDKLAEWAAWAVSEAISDLKDLAEVTASSSSNQSHPLFFMILARLAKIWDETKLFEVFQVNYFGVNHF
jgi:phosphoketolase